MTTKSNSHILTALCGLLIDDFNSLVTTLPDKLIDIKQVLLIHWIRLIDNRCIYFFIHETNRYLISWSNGMKQTNK